MICDQAYESMNQHSPALFMPAQVLPVNGIVVYCMPIPTITVQYCDQDLSNYCNCFKLDCQQEIPKLFELSDTDANSPVSIKKCRRKLKLEDISLDEYLKKLEAMTCQLKYGIEVIQGKRKSARATDNNRERSTFIGVSKNGPNWQALITIKKKKTYIGTFKTEVEAAKAFDKYSILLNNMTAKTNFSYGKEDLLNLVSEFKQGTHTDF